MNYSKVSSLRSKVLEIVRAMWRPSLAFAIMWVALLVITYKYITVSPWTFVMLVFVPMELFDIFGICLLLRNRITKTVVETKYVEVPTNSDYDENDDCGDCDGCDEDDDDDEDDADYDKGYEDGYVDATHDIKEECVDKFFPEVSPILIVNAIQEVMDAIHSIVGESEPETKEEAPKRSHSKKLETKKVEVKKPVVKKSVVTPKRSHHKKVVK